MFTMRALNDSNEHAHCKHRLKCPKLSPLLLCHINNMALDAPTISCQKCAKRRALMFEEILKGNLVIVHFHRSVNVVVLEALPHLLPLHRPDALHCYRSILFHAA